MKPRRKRLLPRPVTVLLCAVLFSALAWLGLYAYREGFSKKWRRFVREEFQVRGVELDFNKLTLDPFDGLVARGVRVYDNEAREHILATINHIALDIDLIRLAKEEPFIDTIDLQNASIALPVSPDQPDGELLELSKINARIYLDGDKMELRKVDAELYGIGVDITGSLLLPQDESEEVSEDVPPTPVQATPPADQIQQIEQRRQLVATIIGHLKKLNFGSGQPPRLKLQVDGQIDHPESIMSEIELNCNEVHYGDFPLDHLKLSANTHDGGFHLEKLEAKSGEESLKAHCSWVKGEPGIRWQVESTLNVPALLEVAEIDLPDLPKFDASPEVSLQGTWFLTEELSKKPSPSNNDDAEAIAERTTTPLPLQCSGSLRCESFQTEGVDFEGIEANFSYDRGRYYVRNGLLSHRSGTLAFQAMQEEPGKFQHRATVKLDPSIFVPFAKTKGSRDVLGMFEFDNDSSVHINITGTGPDHRAAGWKTEGDIDLRDFRVRGTPFSRWESAFTTEAKRIFLNNVRIFRKEGSAVAKMIHIDNEKRTLVFDTFRGQINPVEAIAPFSKKVSDSLRKYRFKEIPTLAIDGQIDIKKGGGERTDLKVYFESNGPTDYDFLGRTLPLANARGQIIFRGKERDLDIGGDVFSGIARVTSSIARDGAYTAHLLAQDLSFEELADVYSKGSKSKGDLNFTFDFHASGKGVENLVGSGEMQLSDGDVYAIPFLGPLSKPLATVLGNDKASYSVAREANATFTIRDGVVRTTDFEALTPYFRLRITGDIDCVEKKLELDAGLNLRGPPGVLLLPVSKLLEYRGRGPVSDPVWAPKQLVSPLSGNPDLRNE